MSLEKSLFKHPWSIWYVPLFLMCLFNFEGGGTNPSARFAQMTALTEDYSFKINKYYDWTIDWAKTPDGNYYSEKPPLPALLAFPVAWVLNRARVALWGDRLYEKSTAGEIRLKEPSKGYKTFFSWILQLIPFCILTHLLLLYLQRAGVSDEALHFSAVSMLYGNTISTMLNVFFGHPVAACALLALTLAWIYEKYFWVGFSYGLLVLSDFGGGFLFPALALALLNSRKGALPVIKGGVIPFLLFMAYNKICFGGPFTLPIKYINPMFQESGTEHLWGVLQVLPNLSIVYELLFGGIRGILFTQPWVLLFLVFYFMNRSKSVPPFHEPAWVIFTMGSFVGLVWMNSCFNNWYSGACPGPRYLSMLFPLFGYLSGAFFDGLSKNARVALWLCLSISVVFRAVEYSTRFLADNGGNVWIFYWDLLNDPVHALKRWMTLTLTAAVLSSAAFLAYKGNIPMSERSIDAC